MGILNVTPDSFSDGGQFADADAAVSRGLALADEGAAIVDVGGESTRPGSAPPTLAVELARVIPVIRGLREASDVLISVDTSRPEVMRAAVAGGADMINDVRALTHPGALAAAVELAVPVCLMHMQGEPGTMQDCPRYDDVVGEVRSFLLDRVAACIAAGVPKERILVDPGFGFGKQLEHNLTLLRRLAEFVADGYPVVVGLSRKALLGQVLGRPIQDRLAGSIALALAARQRGARVVRVHDVAATADAFRMLDAVESPARDGQCEGQME
jgi:dihydropteroate synthase